MLEESEFWSAAQVYAQQESRAIVNLRRQQFEAFFPVFLRYPLGPAHPPRREVLFPGYVFVRLDTQPRWGAISNTFGVIRLLTSSAGLPSRVPLDFISSVRRCVVHDPDELAWELEPGTEVRILRGPLADFSAVTEWIVSERVGLLLSLFGRDTRVECGVRDVAAA